MVKTEKKFKELLGHVTDKNVPYLDRNLKIGCPAVLVAANGDIIKTSTVEKYFLNIHENKCIIHTRNSIYTGHIKATEEA